MSSDKLKERIEQLSPKQKDLLALQLRAQHLDSSVANGQGKDRLVAYVVDNGNFVAGDYRDFLKDRLPDYMIPTTYVPINEFPRLPNGKVNFKALPSADEVISQSEEDYTAPQTTNEKILARIWSEVLNFEPVGIHDNYFEIGGDSILSIQIIAKANKAGLVLKPNALFDHQTIALLALSAESTAEKPTTDILLTGEAPLLPIQHWFFEEHQQASHHWNQGLIFTNTAQISTDHLATAIYQLTLHHDALRMAFKKEGNQWQALISEPQKKEVFHHIDLSTLSQEQQENEIEEQSKQIQAGLDLSEGKLFQGIYFDRGSDQHGELYVFAHHLVVDAVSWGILVEDLGTICEQQKQAIDVSLTAKSTSYKDWGIHLVEMANSGAFSDENEFWKQQTKHIGVLPYDLDAKLPVAEESIVTVDFTLNESDTHKLRNQALTTYNTKIEEFMLAALTQVVAKWSNTTNICFGLERHGREAISNHLNFSNTVGWFTSYFPIALTYYKDSDAGTQLKSVKEQLRKIPNGGIGYGVLRYLCEEEADKIKGQDHPAIIFNYLGNLSSFDAGILGSGKEISSGTRHQKSEHYQMLEINTFIQHDQLKMRWNYSKQLYQSETINNLVQAFEKTLLSFIEHCNAPNTGGFTPSDFPEAGLNQDDLDNLLGEIDL